MNNRIKGQTEEIIQGYKQNIFFKKSQLDIIVQLPSFHSYTSINLYHPNGEKLIDKILPLAMELLSSQFPMVTIKTSSFNYIEILLISTKSYDDIYITLTHIKHEIQKKYRDTRIY